MASSADAPTGRGRQIIQSLLGQLEIVRFVRRDTWVSHDYLSDGEQLADDLYNFPHEVVHVTRPGSMRRT